MCIKYEDYELLELFESDPKVSDERSPGFYIYSIAKNKGFKLILSFNYYGKYCAIHINHNGASVFNCDLQNVTRFKKYENFLIIVVGNEPMLKLNFEKQLGIELISEEQKSMYIDILSQY